MTEIIEGSIYDFPKYYDLLFGSDWRAEFRFLQDVFPKHAGCSVKRVFEPACGTGRLLIKLAQSGYDVGGNDLNEKSINFCNDRLQRFKHARSTSVGDMTNFKVKKKYHAAFNLINSFRHLSTEAAAASHLHCMAAALTKGGLYVLGLHLEPTEAPRMEEEAWSARRGNLAITSYMWSKGIDRRNRQEHLGITLDIYTPTSHRRIVDHMDYRTYKRAQFKSLLKKVPEFEVAEVYDFSYDIDQPHRITGTSEDVVFVLRKV
ncbi:MAG: class I SAM-dependent methyltransferase [Fuerstiella sp.]